MKRLAAALLALGLAPPAAAAPPASVELTFAIRLGSMHIGDVRETFGHGGGRYHVVSQSTPRGLAALFINDIRRESRGAVTADGLRPDRFEETGRRGGTRAATFDWTAGKVTLVNGAATRVEALPPGTLDQTSLAYAFAFRRVAGADFRVHVTDGRGLKAYRYREIGEEVLKTPVGDLRTRHFEKVSDPGDKRGFEFWLSTEHHLLPVKLRYIEKNGDAFDSILTGIRAE